MIRAYNFCTWGSVISESFLATYWDKGYPGLEHPPPPYLQMNDSGKSVLLLPPGHLPALVSHLYHFYVSFLLDHLIMKNLALSILEWSIWKDMSFLNGHIYIRSSITPWGPNQLLKTLESKELVLFKYKIKDYFPIHHRWQPDSLAISNGSGFPFHQWAV